MTWRKQSTAYVCSIAPLALFVLVGRLLGFMLLLPLADLAVVGLVSIQIGEDQIEDVRVPACWTTFETFLNILPKKNMLVST